MEPMPLQAATRSGPMLPVDMLLVDRLPSDERYGMGDLCCPRLLGG